MNCKDCFFKSEDFNNECSLLSDKNVSFKCFCSKEEYKERLREAFRYADSKAERCNKLNKGIWLGYKKTIVNELRLL